MFTTIIFHPPSPTLVHSLPLACGNNFISASISTVINTTSKQFRGNGTQLTSLPIIKGYAKHSHSPLSPPGMERRVQCLIRMLRDGKWSALGFVLRHRHINLIIDSWKWVLQIGTVCDTPTPPPPYPTHPTTPHPHTHKNTHTHTHTHARIVPQVRAWMRMPLLFNAPPPHKCQPALQMPTSLVKRHHSPALYPNLLETYFYHLPPSLFLFSNYKPIGTGRVCMGK